MLGRWATLATRHAASAAASSKSGGWSAAAQLRCMALGSRASGGPTGMSDTMKWKWLKSQGAEVNPCNSAEHPSVMAGMPTSGDEVSVQQAYNPTSSCFCCGHANTDGLRMSSFRIPGGLQASLSIPAQYSAFPGIINGGIVSTIFDCHGNWTAAVALMDKNSIPRPPLTMTYEILVSHKATTPPEQELRVRSQVVAITSSECSGSTILMVQVDMSLHCQTEGGEKVLATATGLFKKTGAMVSL